MLFCESKHLSHGLRAPVSEATLDHGGLIEGRNKLIFFVSLDLVFEMLENLLVLDLTQLTDSG